MDKGWILVTSGHYPNDKEIVQITCRGEGIWKDRISCLVFVYRLNGKWLYDDDDGSVYEIEEDRVIAWRDCIPYGCDKAPTI